jgi:hypothetical protein
MPDLKIGSANADAATGLPTSVPPETQVTTTLQTTNASPSSVDGVLWMLFGGLLFYSVLLIGCYKLFAGDQMILEIVSNLLSGFMGAFFLHIKSQK